MTLRRGRAGAAGLGVGLTLAALLAGCTQQPTLVPSRDLDRPTDMVFGCMGMYSVAVGDHQELRPTGLPMDVCHPPPDAQNRFARTLDANKLHIESRTFAFVANSARGELSVVDMDNSRLVDLDPGLAGFNAAPLGQVPESLAVSDDGCRVVTANRGSCDLSLVNPGVLVADTAAQSSVDAGTVGGDRGAPTQTIVVRTGSGRPLAVAPYEVQFLPQDTSTLVTDDKAARANPATDAARAHMCPQNAPEAPTLGWPGTQTGWKAVVTFPSCDLVAVVDLPSGTIVDSVKLKAVRPNPADRQSDRIQLDHTGTEPTCPIECGIGARTSALAAADEDAGTDSGADAGDDTFAADAVDDGGTDGNSADGNNDGGGDTQDAPGDAAVPTPVFAGHAGVTALAVHPDGSLIYVGLSNAPMVAALQVLGGRLVERVAPGGSTIALNEGAIGTSRLRLSVDQFSGRAFPFLTTGLRQDRKYLYDIARDGTIRVIHVGDTDNKIQECDTNIDPGRLPSGEFTAAQACFPVNDATRKLRRPLVAGPGISLPSPPRDIGTLLVRPPGYSSEPMDPRNTTNPNTALVDGTSASDENHLSGVFAFALTDSGQVYIINIDPAERQVAQVVDRKLAAMDNPLREPSPLANSLRDRNWITYSTTLDVVSGPPRLDTLLTPPPFGPHLEGIFAMDTVDNYTLTATGTTPAVPVRTYVFFPERTAVTPQVWTVTWQGDLIGLSFTGRVAENATPQTLTFSDPGASFCNAFVTKGDLLTLLGCTEDAQCGNGQVCRRSPSAPQSSGGLPLNGLCVTPDQAMQDTLLKQNCRRLLESIRRYEVVTAHTDRLEVRPHVDEVVQAAIDPNRCQHEGDPCGPPTEVDSSHTRFRCRKKSDDPAAALWCVNPCGEGMNADGRARTVDDGDNDCRVGRKCVDFGASAGGRLCADAPASDQLITCFPELTGYRVQAGRSFLVQGNATPVVLPPPTPVGDVCPTPPATFDSAVVRISMDAQACNLNQFPPGLQSAEALLAMNTEDPLADNVTSSTYLPLALVKLRGPIDETKPLNTNPCLFVAGRTEGDKQPTSTVDAGVDADRSDASGDASASDAGDAGKADGGTSANVMRGPLIANQHVRALFRNPQLQFILTNLEQLSADVYQLRFDVHGGFVGQTVVPPPTVEIGLPTRLLVSPLAGPGTPDTQGNPKWDGPQYMYVVDQRRLGRSRLGGGATRGQILRINLQRYPSSDLEHPVLTYDDFTASSGLFPIQ